LKRTPLRRVSRKREAERAQRQACVQVVLERDRTCQYVSMVFRARRSLSPADWAMLTKAAVIGCRGHLTVHEPGHRRNVDYLDPASCICLCFWHNVWVENCPEAAYHAGLLIKANGLAKALTGG
jgi:hypothetical protein